MEEYIHNSVNEQLQDAVKIVFDEEKLQRLPPEEQSPPERRPLIIPDMRMLPRGPLDKAEAMIVSAHYELVFPEAGTIFLRNYDEMNNLVAQLKIEQADLKSTEIMRLKASGREYYFVSMKMPQAVFHNNAYLIYYIDMTALTSFSKRINAVLLAVMGIAGILAVGIAVFLSGKITEPIRELKRFAVRIGHGDFMKSALHYGDAELAELAESMNKAAAQLDAYDREQKTFFQNASHELRTPLQAIRSNAEGIEHGILDNKKSSRVIISETDRLSEMVEDLLYLSRIDNMNICSNFEEWDLRELLSNCAERQRSLAAEREIQFVFEFDEPVNMHCDGKHMTRALSNLISNAIRYAKNKITLSCCQNNDEITIVVADDGAGIADEDLPHIFNRFYKGSRGKHGIGLSIVKSIIEQHNGKIEARNTNKGAFFVVTFRPLEQI